MGKEWIAILNELREGLTERHLKESLKEVRESHAGIWGKRILGR